MQHAGKLLEMRAQALALRGEALEVAADTEHAPRAAQEHGAYCAILAAADRRVHELVPHLAVQRIAGIGAIERDARDVILQFVAERPVFHGSLPPL